MLSSVRHDGDEFDQVHGSFCTTNSTNVGIDLFDDRQVNLVVR